MYFCRHVNYCSYDDQLHFYDGFLADNWRIFLQRMQYGVCPFGRLSDYNVFGGLLQP